ncbi:hypothetical protein CesoFtcFv8_000022 [Champsocephalus esox]|uniref:Uncharacterized protein n=2 Tax=Champsocephalus TaxID=52236 RepID=A0AAN8HWU0_CHAGU|nr:hypothetical protein CgunFtcFv8_026956 [Champsocephalus gunnari]KAK5931728.1 hypothetical protein CesoFtcFv8_000022 [Champsocephalus esox]
MIELQEEISNYLRRLARQKGEDKVALMRSGRVGEEKQRGEEALERGKGGTADILSALGAVSDLRGEEGLCCAL